MNDEYYAKHSLILFAREPVCAISLGARDLELRIANKRATLLPGDIETARVKFKKIVGKIKKSWGK